MAVRAAEATVPVEEPVAPVLLDHQDKVMMAAQVVASAEPQVAVEAQAVVAEYPTVVSVLNLASLDLHCTMPAVVVAHQERVATVAVATGVQSPQPEQANLEQPTPEAVEAVVGAAAVLLVARAVLVW
jgi:hypothetical protein